MSDWAEGAAEISGPAAASGQWWLPLATEGVKAFGSAAGAPAGGGGPSRSDTGGVFGFNNSNWVVSTSSSKASLTPSQSITWLLALAGVGLVAWKLYLKKY